MHQYLATPNQNLMVSLGKLFPFLKSRKDYEKQFSLFLKNGSSLVEELIVSLNGRYKLPVPNLAAEEIIRATNNFSEPVYHIGDTGRIFKGTLDKIPVLIKIFTDGKKFNSSERNEDVIHGLIREIVIASQMSHLKNVLKFIGCCLEFKYPAIVYEYAGTKLVPSLIAQNMLSWKRKLKISKDIANVIVHLHTDFPTPIIFRNLTLDRVIIDGNGVAKLFSFEDSIWLPPGQVGVEDKRMVGTSAYLDPEYVLSMFVTQKTDVYTFGVLMLLLFTGRMAAVVHPEGNGEMMHIREHVEGCIQKGVISQIFQPKAADKTENCNVQEHQMLLVMDLALRCTRFEGNDRPDMIDVARELYQIQKQFTLS